MILLAGCASSQDDPNAPSVTIHLTPYDSSSNAYTYNGPVAVKFELSIANTTKDPVTLNRIEIRTIGSGAYTIQPISTPINVVVAPGQGKAMPISVWGYARGGRLSSEEPVTVRGTAYLTGPQGAFVKLFTEYITQQ